MLQTSTPIFFIISMDEVVRRCKHKTLEFCNALWFEFHKKNITCYC